MTGSFMYLTSSSFILNAVKDQKAVGVDYLSIHEQIDRMFLYFILFHFYMMTYYAYQNYIHSRITMFIRIMRSNNFRGQWESFLQFILTECFQPLGKCTRNVKWNGNNKNHQTTCLRIKSFQLFLLSTLGYSRCQCNITKNPLNIMFCFNNIRVKSGT